MVMEKKLKQRLFGWCIKSCEGKFLDFVGFFGIVGGEFSWIVLTPILVKYA
jgi:hypothetical protein